jgi:AhpD family alkylhydroperoxidase
MADPLDAGTEELIAIGAALASHCELCLRYHIRQATEVGCTKQEMHRAVEIAQDVKVTPARLLTNLAARLLGSSSAHPEPEASCTTQGPERAGVPSRSCCSRASSDIERVDRGSPVGQS